MEKTELIEAIKEKVLQLNAMLHSDEDYITTNSSDWAWTVTIGSDFDDDDYEPRTLEEIFIEDGELWCVDDSGQSISAENLAYLELDDISLMLEQTIEEIDDEN